MKYLFIILLSFQINAQQKKFFLQGNTNIKTDSVWLIQPNAKIFNFFNIENGISKKPSLEGKFKFQGNIDYPTYFWLVTDNTISDGFFLENSYQELEYHQNKDSRITLRVRGSKTNDEYIKLRNVLKSAHITSIFDNTEVNDALEDYILLNYIKKNPSSFVALWILIERFSNNKPNHYQEEALSSFSDNIKSTSIFKAFLNKIDDIRNFQNTLRDGFVLKNMELKKEDIILKNKNQYVLLDFWFSYCKPCIYQMPKFLSIYEKYGTKNFEIIGISIDREKDLPNWKRKIVELNINWKNYWDENSDFSRKMNVSKYPTNFLLDPDGNIIAQDVSPEKLDDYLSTKLMKK